MLYESIFRNAMREAKDAIAMCHGLMEAVQAKYRALQDIPSWMVYELVRDSQHLQDSAQKMLNAVDAGLDRDVQYESDISLDDFLKGEGSTDES